MIHLKPLIGFLQRLHNDQTWSLPWLPLRYFLTLFLSDILSHLPLSLSTCSHSEPTGSQLGLSPPDGGSHHALCLVCLSLLLLVLQIQLSLPRPLNQTRGDSNLSTPPSQDGARHRTHQEHGSCFEYSNYHRIPRSPHLDSIDTCSHTVLCCGSSPGHRGVLNSNTGLYSECW